MKDDAALLPCPFCGGQPKIKTSRSINDAYTEYWVSCRCVENRICSSIERAAKYWNTRPQPERVSDKAQRFGGDAAPVAADAIGDFMSSEVYREDGMPYTKEEKACLIFGGVDAHTSDWRKKIKQFYDYLASRNILKGGV